MQTSGTNLYYTTNSVTLGGGMSTDVILDTTGVPPGDYYLYAAEFAIPGELRRRRPTGGMMTKIVSTNRARRNTMNSDLQNDT